MLSLREERLPGYAFRIIKNLMEDMQSTYIE